MATMTEETLAAVPVGGQVYYNDKVYTRLDDQWWGIGDSTTPLIRDRFFNGALAAGKVTDALPIKPGATAVGDRYWYYIKDEPDAQGFYPCIRIVAPQGEREGQGTLGQVNQWDRRVRPGWLRERIGPLPPEAEAYLRLALAAEIENQKAELSRMSTAYNELYAQQDQLRAEHRDIERLHNRLRTVLQEILA